MAKRRNRDDAGIGLAAQLAGVVVLLSLISPQVRQTISPLGILAICFLGLVVVCVVGLVGLGLYRLVFGSQPAQPVERNWDWQSVKIEVKGEQNTPKPTADLIKQLRTIDWFQFEKLVALIYRKSGYAVTPRGGANPDGGIDLVIEKDGQSFAIQCKQWKTWNVGVKAVREFLGALTDSGISKGIFITLCGYTGEAKQLADKHGIEIINEVGLVQLLEATGAYVNPEVLGILNDTRKFCPKCEAEMVLRTATKGRGAGRQFWGCSSYPKCRFTLPAT